MVKRSAANADVAEWTNPRWLLELFILSNIAFLALDIYLAHLSNSFHHPAEWIPVWFSVAASVVLLWGVLPAGYGGQIHQLSGRVVGYLAIALGYAGLIYHLQSSFFQEKTLRSLVYSAPFAAPLAYAGLGFLLLLNRSSVPGQDWRRWVLFFAAGGFAGNFFITLVDHAQNGFFEPSEWLPVYSSAMATSFLAVFLFRVHDRPLRSACWVVLGAQVVLGVLGAILHVQADLLRLDEGIRQGFVYGAPIFAPLLLADVALLGAIGLR